MLFLVVEVRSDLAIASNVFVTGPGTSTALARYLFCPHGEDDASDYQKHSPNGGSNQQNVDQV